MDSLRTGCVGIAGGYSFRATAHFSNNLLRRFQRIGRRAPTIITVTNAVAPHIESLFICAKSGEDGFRSSMKRTVSILRDSGCDFLVLPCNSLHMLFMEVCAEVDVDGLSPVQALQDTALPSFESSYGLLATSQLRQSGLIEECLPEQVEVLVEQSEFRQVTIDNLILNIIADGPKPVHVQNVTEVIKEIRPCVDRWIIACSELSILTPELRRANPELEFIDTLELLVRKTFERCDDEGAVDE